MSSIEERFNIVTAASTLALSSQEEQIMNGLSSSTKTIPYFMLYDTTGSQIFEAITTLPEYYQTRAEKEIIDTSTHEICAHVPTCTVVVELGSGSATKTVPIIQSLLRQVQKSTERAVLAGAKSALESRIYYVPIDISHSMLVESSKRLLTEIDDPSFFITAVCGFYSEGMEAVRRMFPGEAKLVLWLGSSIGNLDDLESKTFIKEITRNLSTEDHFLIGMDLMKDEDVLIAAYDDSQNVTANFTKNILVRLNKEYCADFQVDKFRHIAVVNSMLNRVEIFLESTITQKVFFPNSTRHIQFSAGERIHVENCQKYVCAEIPKFAEEAGLCLKHSWLDSKKLFSLNLFSPLTDGELSISRKLLSAEESEQCCQSFLSRLCDSWKVSDRVFQSLGLSEGPTTSANFSKTPISLRHPFIFYLGHLPAFEHSHILRHFARLKVNFGSIPGESYARIFERGIDPYVDDPTQCHPHSANISGEQWPSVTEVRNYRDYVRKSILELLPALIQYCCLEKAKQVVQLCEEHTLMHSETLLYMLMQTEKNCLDISHLPSFSVSKDQPELNNLEDFVEIEAGKVTLGATYGSIEFGWDNEFGTKDVFVNRFQIGKYPVTNVQFWKFLKSGGYNNSLFWRDEDWAWKQSSKMEHPASWRRDAEGVYFCRTLFGDIELSEVGLWPACVSWAEATAYATWKGARLITEAEFHLVADEKYEDIVSSKNAPCKEIGNFNFKRWSPTPVNEYPAGATSTGVWDLIGNGWELTSDLFMPFPGFIAHIPHYPGYSSDFFDQRHYVLAGASWATSDKLIRKSFRNFYQSHYPYMFSKFRIAKDVK